MWLDAVALVILTVFAVLGALRGALATAMGLISLAVAYGASVGGLGTLHHLPR